MPIVANEIPKKPAKWNELTSIDIIRIRNNPLLLRLVAFALMIDSSDPNSDSVAIGRAGLNRDEVMNSEVKPIKAAPIKPIKYGGNRAILC